MADKQLKTEIQKVNLKQGETEPVNDMMLLATLLKRLRAEHEIGLLTICKQIKSIEIADGVAEIDADASWFAIT